MKAEAKHIINSGVGIQFDKGQSNHLSWYIGLAQTSIFKLKSKHTISETNRIEKEWSFMIIDIP